jgi:hypothetical protein
MAQRFAISFDSWYGWLSTVLLLSPASSFVEIEGDFVRVQMGWAFRARFPRSCLSHLSRLDRRPLSRGVHGTGGRWLVNGAGTNIVVLDLTPAQRAYVTGFPVRLRQLMVSVTDPDLLESALG